MRFFFELYIKMMLCLQETLVISIGNVLCLVALMKRRLAALGVPGCADVSGRRLSRRRAECSGGRGARGGCCRGDAAVAGRRPPPSTRAAPASAAASPVRRAPPPPTVVPVSTEQRPAARAAAATTQVRTHNTSLILNVAHTVETITRPLAVRRRRR